MNVIAKMQGKIDSKTMRGPNTDPMTDLAIRFLTLELITDNRSSKDKTLCETSLKGTGRQAMGPARYCVHRHQ